MKSSAPITGFFYSGFLTETGKRRIEPISTAADDWGRSVAAFVGPHASLQRLHWASVRFEKIVPSVDQLNARKFGLWGILPHCVDTWKLAIGRADAEAKSLAEWLDARLGAPVLLVGHSLGARIILKAAMQSKHRHVHIVALAPALSLSEFDMAVLTSTHRTIDIFFSPTDYILGVAYPAGQSESGAGKAMEVLGQRGLPPCQKPLENIHFHDTSVLLGRESFGHTDYADALPELAKHSRVLQRLKDGDASFSTSMLPAVC